MITWSEKELMIVPDDATAAAMRLVTNHEKYPLGLLTLSHRLDERDAVHMSRLTYEADRAPVLLQEDKDSGFYRCIASRHL